MTTRAPARPPRKPRAGRQQLVFRPLTPRLIDNLGPKDLPHNWVPRVTMRIEAAAEPPHKP